MRWIGRNSSGLNAIFISVNMSQTSCRLKKVQGKKKRDADKAEAAKIEADADGGVGVEFKVEEAPLAREQPGDLLNARDEDVIF
jgi:hypothetical protein